MPGSYPPAHHSEHSPEKLLHLIGILRLATLISVHDGESSVSFVPMLVEHGEAPVLTGHLDAANPQAALLDGRRMQAVFHGPQAYISPDDYLSRQLPTWNYAHVVASGPVEEIPGDDAKRALLIRMSETFGGASQVFSLDYADPRMAGMLGGIRAFCMRVDRLVGRLKLSQDKNRDDAQSVLAAMKRKSAARETAVFRWIEDEEMLP
ncbi:MAG TPA: FMN-binding negative transcriptional regulator [Gammaproteobacteria bacterium]